MSNTPRTLPDGSTIYLATPSNRPYRVRMSRDPGLDDRPSTDQVGNPHATPRFPFRVVWDDYDEAEDHGTPVDLATLPLNFALSWFYSCLSEPARDEFHGDGCDPVNDTGTFADALAWLDEA